MEIDYSDISVIGFDADDTLWVNETYFREAEEQFAELFRSYETPNKIDQELFKKELQNLPIYGYGVKGFMLSMIEMGLELTNYKVEPKLIEAIINIGKEMLNKPVELLPGIELVLKELSQKYRLILATKGDLLDQERKLEKSGLSGYFHHIEVLSEKQPENYARLLDHLDITPRSFLMVGNSLKSDILPLIELGAQAIHIPFHTTWEHEKVRDQDLKDHNYKTVSSADEILEFLM
ncbi:HAD family hydrolase [Winogradskyella aurantiaca]|uniref:HAD family hydrolase n=1 Tax=Winogradskyella aurantiaca TaxID=2219558 RepID=UPI000E1DA302|nr:HAD family hydrolase [Winogradskyella aurantiaca]